MDLYTIMAMGRCQGQGHGALETKNRGVAPATGSSVLVLSAFCISEFIVGVD